jgi:DNA-binding transcriptional ArsR family regulator
MAIETDLSKVLYALSDPSRLLIVQLLNESKGERRCGDFQDAVGVSKPTLSHHFAILRESGIINTRVDGNMKFNSLNREGLNRNFPGLLEAVLRSVISK